MSILLLISATIMGFTTAIHLFAGTPEIMSPIMAADLTLEVRATQLVVWHGITAILTLMTAALLYLAFRPNRPLAVFVLAIQLAFSALFIATTLTMFSTLFALPQWTLFVPVALLIIASLRTQKAPSHT